MNIITILGSPRERGNTATLLGWFEAVAQKQHIIERINLAGTALHGCLGCDGCQHITDQPGCVQKDQISAILRQLPATGLIVYASPVYAWDFTAQMKTLFDRHYCLLKWKDRSQPSALLDQKRVVLLVTCGGGAAGNADLIQEIFHRQMRYLHCRIAGQYIQDNCSTPVNLPVTARESVQRMAADVLQTLSP